MISFLSSFLSLLLILLLSSLIADQLFGIRGYEYLIKCYVFSVLFISINDNLDGVLRTYNQYNSILKINIITNLSRLVLVVYFIYFVETGFLDKTFYILSCFVLAFAIGTLLRFIYLKKALNEEKITPLKFIVENLVSREK